MSAYGSGHRLVRCTCLLLTRSAPGLGRSGKITVLQLHLGDVVRHHKFRFGSGHDLLNRNTGTCLQ